jgi:hypothetical protein
MPAKAGTQGRPRTAFAALGPRFRGGDGKEDGHHLLGSLDRSTRNRSSRLRLSRHPLGASTHSDAELMASLSDPDNLFKNLLQLLRDNSSRQGLIQWAEVLALRKRQARHLFLLGKDPE